MPLPFGHEISVRIFSLGINPLFEKMINKKIEFLSYKIILVMLLDITKKIKRATLYYRLNEVNGAFL
jgi:hypothetical protein